MTVLTQAPIVVWAVCTDSTEWVHPLKELYSTEDQAEKAMANKRAAHAVARAKFKIDSDWYTYRVERIEIP